LHFSFDILYGFDYHADTFFQITILYLPTSCSSDFANTTAATSSTAGASTRVRTRASTSTNTNPIAGALPRPILPSFLKRDFSAL
jgi:hypothetical protein